MKRLWILIIVTAVLGFVGLIALGIQYWQFRSVPEDEKQRMISAIMELASMRELQRTSQTFIDEIVPAITAQWSPDSYLSYVKPHVMSGKEKSIIRMYLGNVGAIYGSLVEYRGSEGDIHLRGNSIQDAVVFADYQVTAIYRDKGQVQFRVSLSKDPGTDQWFLEGFHGL